MARSYGLLEHGSMVGDRRTMDAYLDAIRRSVRPGSVVVDIGSGTGMFALAACEAGARRVFALEASPIAQVAKAVIAANGRASQVDCIEQLSTNVTLPERADVIIMNVRGVLPDDQIPVAIDARERFLAASGVIIPAVDVIWAAPVEAPELYDRQVSGAQDDDAVDMAAARTWALAQSSRCRVQGSQLAAEPRRCAVITYLTVDRTDVEATLDWQVARPAVLHGVVAWFESELCEGVRLSNRPGEPEALNGQRFFPFPRPVSVAAGQHVRAGLRGKRKTVEYDWQCILDD